MAACQTLGSAVEQEEYEIPPFARMPPVRKVLHLVSSSLVTLMDDSRRGEASENLIDTIAKLGDKFGSDFLDAIEQNKRDHESDCQLSWLQPLLLCSIRCSIATVGPDSQWHVY
jgi:hypothetical protein